MEINSTNSQARISNVQKDNNSLGKNEFLNILAAQLQFQDPLKGGDNTEYVAQLAQFSALEQMENLNTSFNELKTNQNLLYGTLLIGKMVDITFNDQMISGIVDKVKFSNSMLKLIVNDEEYNVKNVVSIAGEPLNDFNKIIESISNQLDSAINEDVAQCVI